VNDKQISQWLSLIAKGHGKWSAALEVGIAPVVLRRRLAQDLSLAEEVRTAEELALEATIKALRSVSSDPDHPQFMQAAKQLLNARHEDYAPPSRQDEGQPAIRIEIQEAAVHNVLAALEARNKELNPGVSPAIKDEPDNIIDVIDVDDGVVD
jgi:hypothetical protein